ncbi:MAG: LD-carboxypeptidase [Acidobacteriota bacterium]|nr:LD-carboxypeptidase [Acidobacteriota bacterium]
MLTKPRALPNSAHIIVLAASGPSERARIEEGARVIERRGHRVTIAGNIDHRYRGYLAGDDDERAEELNRAFRSPEYDAFFFSRGGYGAMRLLERIDYAAFAANPRPLVGFSDITALHQALATQCGMASFHGPMINLDFCNGLSAEVEEWLWRMLGGESEMTWRFSDENVVAEGEAEGPLFGGCLALTDSLVGTPYDYWVDGGIWFWEDVEEPIYRLDRMLTHLRLSGRMPAVRGVIVGSLKNCGDEAEMLEFLRDFFGPLNVPVVRNLPIGHHGNNLLMPVGRHVRLSTADPSFTVTEPAVTL